MLPATSLTLLSCRSLFLDDSKVYCPLANLYLKAYLNKYVPDVAVPAVGLVVEEAVWNGAA